MGTFANYPLYEQYKRMVVYLSKTLKLSFEDALHKFYNSQTYEKMDKLGRKISYGNLGDDEKFIQMLKKELQIA